MEGDDRKKISKRRILQEEEVYSNGVAVVVLRIVVGKIKKKRNYINFCIDTRIPDLEYYSETKVDFYYPPLILEPTPGTNNNC